MRAASPVESGQLSTRGFRISYEVFGDPRAPGVLLLPTWQIAPSLHWKLQVPALAIVLPTEHLKQRKLPHTQLVLALKGPLDVRLDAIVQHRERAPALRQGRRRPFCLDGRHRRGLLTSTEQILPRLHLPAHAINVVRW